MTIQVYHYPQFPQSQATVHIALFSNVKNAAQLRTRLIQAATMQGPEGDVEREAVNFAFIDARLICSVQHLRTAIYHALLASAQGALRTKSVHSEIIWTLNPTNNARPFITEALRRYGVSSTSQSLFVVRVCGQVQDFADQLSATVDGTPVPLTHLQDITDWETIKKHYKLNSEPAIRNAAGDRGAERAKIDSIVTSSVATKMVMA
ncbi:kinase binding protein CGI-121-domain-containing protein [Cytidiella melzeri]|nr:kinase binding protein CGI-121-domain-containing protein [Cytidiella melzeri]